MATITTDNGGLQACQEALVLLRQDRDLPTTQDGALDVSRDVVAKKVDRVYDSTRGLLVGSYGWNAIVLTDGDNTEIATWPRQIRAAFVALLARELAIPVTGRQEDLKAMHELYEMKLAEAKTWDWRDGLGKETDPIVREVFAGIQERSDGKNEKDWNYRRMRERILELKDRARTEVLAERDWNFARRSMEVLAECVDEAGAFGAREVSFRVPLPPLCVKVHSVDGRDGTPLAQGGWWIEDGFLKCLDREPTRITYTADVKDVGRWEPTVREAYFALIMCKVVKSTPEIGVRAQLLNGEYAELIRKAALRDAKETQPGRVVWGENVYADAIRGFQGRRVQRFQGCRGRYA